MDRKYFNQSQPQTVQVAVFLLYANVVVSILFRAGNHSTFEAGAQAIVRSTEDYTRLLGTLITVAFIVGSAFAAYLIANERRLGYNLGLAAAGLPIGAAVLIVTIGYPSRIGLLHVLDVGLIFDAALLVLLLHKQTRDYVKAWFK